MQIKFSGVSVIKWEETNRGEKEKEYQEEKGEEKRKRREKEKENEKEEEIPVLYPINYIFSLWVYLRYFSSPIVVSFLHEFLLLIMCRICRKRRQLFFARKNTQQTICKYLFAWYNWYIFYSLLFILLIYFNEDRYRENNNSQKGSCAIRSWAKKVNI